MYQRWEKESFQRSDVRVVKLIKFKADKVLLEPREEDTRERGRLWGLNETTEFKHLFFLYGAAVDGAQTIVEDMIQV